MIVCRAGVLALPLVLLCAPLGQTRERENKFPPKVLTILEKADKLELFSSPDNRKEVKDGFHGWEVLGQVEIKSAKVRKQLVEALKKGVQDSDGRSAKCFDPRHGLRATHAGTSVDLIICFACLQIEVPSTKGRPVLTTSFPQAVFDKVLRAAKVPLAKPKR